MVGMTPARRKCPIVNSREVGTGAARLRTQCRIQVTPIRTPGLYTSHADSVVKEHARAVGFHAVVPKDTGAEVILVHARNLLGIGASQL